MFNTPVAHSDGLMVGGDEFWFYEDNHLIANFKAMLYENFTLNLIVILDGNRETTLLGGYKLQLYKEIHASRK